MDITAAEMKDIHIYYANYMMKSEYWCTGPRVIGF